MSVLVTYKYVGEWVCQMEEKEQLPLRSPTIRMLTNRTQKTAVAVDLPADTHSLPSPP